MREFLLTYPNLEPGSTIDVLPFSPNITDGNGISYTGLGTPVIERDVTIGSTVTYRASFSMDILRHLIDEISNEEITEFMMEFEQWVIEQSLMGNAPRFGREGYDETMWAQGGILYMVQQPPDVQIPFAAYRTNIIIQFQKFYKSEVNW